MWEREYRDAVPFTHAECIVDLASTIPHVLVAFSFSTLASQCGLLFGQCFVYLAEPLGDILMDGGFGNTENACRCANCRAGLNNVVRDVEHAGFDINIQPVSLRNVFLARTSPIAITKICRNCLFNT